MAVTRAGDDRGRGRVPGREQKSGLRARSVGRRKTKERLRNPSQPYCVHPRSKSFLLSSAGFIRGPKPWQPPIRCPLSSLRATSSPQNAAQLPDPLSRPHLGLVQVCPRHADLQGRRRALRLRNDSGVIQRSAIETGEQPSDLFCYQSP